MALQGKLSNPHNWVAEPLNGSGYIFWDPVEGAPTNPDTIPTWLEAEPQLSAGIDYLHDQNSNVNVTIAYGGHARAGDLGAIENGWFEQQVHQADHYGYEEVGHTEAHARMEAAFAVTALRAALRRGTDYHTYLQAATSLEPRLKDDTFLVRRLRAMALEGNSFSFDAKADKTPTEQAIIKAIARTAYAAAAPKNAAEHLAADNAREWLMVANTGVHLRKNHKGNSDDVFETLGMMHNDVTRKFRVAGANVDAKLVAFNNIDEPTKRLRHTVTAINASGKVSTQEAAHLAPLPAMKRGALGRFIR
jgi:hypothetical protein